MKKLAAFAALAALACGAQGARFSVKSPDESVEAVVSDDGGELKFSFGADGKTILSPFAVGMKTSRADIGAGAKLKRVRFERIDAEIPNNFGVRSAARDKCSELKLSIAKGVWIIVRAYDDAVAYRFETRLGDSDITVLDEIFSLPLSDSDEMVAHPLKGAETSFESEYVFGKIAEMKKTHTAMLPFVFKKSGFTIALAESALEDYPSMRLCYPAGAPSPRAWFARYPKKFSDEKKYEWQASETEPFIAKTNGIRKYPWRAFAIARSESELAASDLVFRLGEPSRVEDTSWIKGGLATWDWWNDWALTGVDFESGINFQTYKFHIDYAAAHGIPWVVVDTGWLNGGEIGRVSHEFCDEMLMERTPHLDLPRVIKYAREKGVKIMPWVLARTMDRYGEDAFKLFKQWGADGLKIDFIDRDDQLATRMAERFARLAAKYKLVVDFHGCPPPAGLQRKYPNALNFEGVRGHESTKWSPVSTAHNLTIPFVRMFAGAMDYTPGGMRNAAAGQWRQCYKEPVSCGTRAHMVAQYVVYFAPFQMMCASPSEYLKSPETLKAITSIPTAWDETKVLGGKIAEYIVIARRKGGVWFVAGMCAGKGREVSIELPELFGSGSGAELRADIFMDAPNSDRVATDFRAFSSDVQAGGKIKIKMADDGGFVAKLSPKAR